VVNENDTVSFEEITFGDNDILAAHLANMIDADLLILLTDTDGLFSSDPRQDENAEIVSTVEKISDEIIGSARGKGSSFSSGGMESKLRAARSATQSGVGVVIGNGRTPVLLRIAKGEEIGTYFVPAEKRIRGRKKWIAFYPKAEGQLVIDAGGERAICQSRKSLLPAGIMDVIGSFSRGDNVSILNEKRQEIARGLVNFSSSDLQKIKGLKTNKIPQVLGTNTIFDEAVHRDNMVVTGRPDPG
jgi:glutamate 5-kinase